jgi:transcriptional regulator with XRE-family HTH domain
MKMFMARARLAFSQKELCERTGISQAFFSAIESGRCMPAADVALRIAKELRLSMEDLLEIDDSTPTGSTEAVQ